MNFDSSHKGTTLLLEYKHFSIFLSEKALFINKTYYLCGEIYEKKRCKYYKITNIRVLIYSVEYHKSTEIVN